jgi:hypothetical protein
MLGVTSFCGAEKSDACPDHTRCLAGGSLGDNACVCDDDHCALDDKCVSKEVYFKEQHAERIAQAMLALPDVSRPSSHTVETVLTLSLLSALMLGFRRCKPRQHGDSYFNMSHMTNA